METFPASTGHGKWPRFFSKLSDIAKSALLSNTVTALAAVFGAREVDTVVLVGLEDLFSFGLVALAFASAAFLVFVSRIASSLALRRAAAMAPFNRWSCLCFAAISFFNSFSLDCNLDTTASFSFFS